MVLIGNTGTIAEQRMWDGWGSPEQRRTLANAFEALKSFIKTKDPLTLTIQSTNLDEFYRLNIWARDTFENGRLRDYSEQHGVCCDLPRRGFYRIQIIDQERQIDNPGESKAKGAASDWDVSDSEDSKIVTQIYRDFNAQKSMLRSTQKGNAASSRVQEHATNGFGKKELYHALGLLREFIVNNYRNSMPSSALGLFYDKHPGIRDVLMNNGGLRMLAEAHGFVCKREPSGNYLVTLKERGKKESEKPKGPSASRRRASAFNKATRAASKSKANPSIDDICQSLEMLNGDQFDSLPTTVFQHVHSQNALDDEQDKNADSEDKDIQSSQAEESSDGSGFADGAPDRSKDSNLLVQVATSAVTKEVKLLSQQTRPERSNAVGLDIAEESVSPTMYPEVSANDMSPSSSMYSNDETSTPADFTGFFFHHRGFEKAASGVSLLGRKAADELSICDRGHLGMAFIPEGQSDEDMQVYLNTHEPFCIITTGVQGSGKSHTVATIIENCMLRADPIIKVDPPMCTLVFHFEAAETSRCEAASLVRPNPEYLQYLRSIKSTSNNPIPSVQNLIVLTSPSYFMQRKQYYDGWPNTTVVPLLLPWNRLGASQLRTLMRLGEGDNQLYVSVMLEVLRRLQLRNQKPDFASFLDEVGKCFSLPGQSSPLKQRLELLKSLVAENYSQEDKKKGFQPVFLESLIASGTMIVADLTDPMLSSDEANGIFNVLLELFRNARASCGKLCVFDEAHKYISADTAPLARTIVSTVRQMRHFGIRIVVSTQSPKVMPPELLELVSICILHRFHSKDWYQYLTQKIPISNDFAEVMTLQTGQALVFASRAKLDYDHNSSLAPSANKDVGWSWPAEETGPSSQNLNQSKNDWGINIRDNVEGGNAVNDWGQVATDYQNSDQVVNNWDLNATADKDAGQFETEPSTLEASMANHLIDTRQNDLLNNGNRRIRLPASIVFRMQIRNRFTADGGFTMKNR